MDSFCAFLSGVPWVKNRVSNPSRQSIARNMNLMGSIFFLIAFVVTLLVSPGQSTDVNRIRQGASVFQRLIRTMKQSHQSFERICHSSSPEIQSTLPFVLLHAVANDPAWLRRDWTAADAEWMQPPLATHGPVDVFGNIRRRPETWPMHVKPVGFSLSMQELFGLLLSHGPTAITDPTGLFLMDDYLRDPEHQDLWLTDLGSRDYTNSMEKLQDLIYTKLNQLSFDSPVTFDAEELWIKWRSSGQVSDLVRILQATRVHGDYVSFNGGYWASALGVLRSSGTPTGTKMLTLLIIARHDHDLFKTLFDFYMVMETFGLSLHDWVVFLDRFARLKLDGNHPSRQVIGAFLLKSKNTFLVHSDTKASLGMVIRGYYIAAPSSRLHLSSLIDSLMERSQDLEDALFAALTQDDPEMIRRLSDSAKEKYALIDILRAIDQEPKKIMESMYGSLGAGNGKLWTDPPEYLANFALRNGWDSTFQLMMSSPEIVGRLTPSNLKDIISSVRHISFTREASLLKMHAFTDWLSDASFMAWVLVKDLHHLERLEVVISDETQFNRFMALLSKDPGRAIGALVKDFCSASKNLAACVRSLESKGIETAEMESILGKLRNAVKDAKGSFGAHEEKVVSVIDQGMQTDEMDPMKPEQITYHNEKTQEVETSMPDSAVFFDKGIPLDTPMDIPASIKNGHNAANVEHHIPAPIAAIESAQNALSHSTKAGGSMKRNGLILVSVLATLTALGLGLVIGHNTD